MDDQLVEPGSSQADMIREELNFDVDPNDPLTKASLADHPQDEWMDILGNGQLRKKVLAKGQPGTRPTKNDICTLNMSGELEDGTVVDDDEDVIIQLGDVEVIQGLDLAIALMDVDEVAEIEVAPRFAYGSLGKMPLIPPDATITYTVTLKNVELEKEILTVDEKRKIGNAKRERGNWWFIRNEPELAIQCYRKALTFLSPTTNSDEKTEHISDSELQALLEDKMVVYNNIAAAQIRTEAYDAALQSLENVLSCQPNNVKALYRKGKILCQKKEYALAQAALLQASKLSPDLKCIQQDLQTLKRQHAIDVERQKNLYRKMFGAKVTTTTTNGSLPIETTKVQKSSVKRSPKKKSTKISKTNKTNALMWSLIGGATAAMLGILLYKFTS